MSEVVDVVVVGGGPSGALAARELARRGATVVVLERETFPRWKVCGACVGPAALSSLGAVGLADLPRRGGAVPLEELLVVGPSGVSAGLPLEGGVAWSRAALDSALMAEAERAGASVRLETRAELGPVEGATRLVTARCRGTSAPSEIRARLVVDASGLGGAPERGTRPVPDRVAEETRVGLGTLLTDGRILRPGGSPLELVPGRIVMIVGRTGYVGMVRLEDGTVDVAAAVDQRALRGRTPDDAVAAVLAEAGCSLDGAPARPWRGTPPLTRAPARAATERCLRVGDALGYVEPFTGEGIGWALASARAVQPVALRALDGWSTGAAEEWEAYRLGSAARAKRVCRAVSWGLRRPGLVNTALSMLRGAPWLSAPVLRVLGRPPGHGRPRWRRARAGRAP